MMMINIGPMSICGRQASNGGFRVDICRGDDVVLCTYFTLDQDNGSAAVKVFKMMKGNTGDGWLLFGRVEPKVPGQAAIHDKGGAWELSLPEAPPPNPDDGQILEQIKAKAQEILAATYEAVKDKR